MKILLVLYVTMFDQSGNVISKQPVNDIKYKTHLDCHVEKSYYKNDTLIKFTCEKENI